MQSQEDRLAEMRARDSKRMTMIAGIIERTMMRHRKLEDPTMRAVLLVDKLTTIFDTALIALQSDSELNDETNVKLERAFGLISEELDFLVQWVQSPVYSPDHPVGRSMMNESKNHFADVSTKK